MYFESKNPSTKEILKAFNEITNEELELKLQKANLSFLSWRDTSLEKRKELFFNLANYLRENKEFLGEIASLEMGKTKNAGISEVLKCADCVEYYAKNAEKFLKVISYDGVNDENYISIEPIGTILSVMPWIFAIVLFLTRVGAATIEIMSESYFFKIVKEEDADEIAFFRNTRAVSFLIAPGIATLLLLYLPSFQYLFYILGVVLLIGLWMSLRMEDVK